MAIIILLLPLIPYLIYSRHIGSNAASGKADSFFNAIEFLVMVFAASHFAVFLIGKNTNIFLQLGKSWLYSAKYIFLEVFVSAVFLFLNDCLEKHKDKPIAATMQKAALPAKSILLGVTIFSAVFGVNVLNPTYTDWLMTGGDLTQHYLGWCFFRTSGWQFPVGLFDGLSYPGSCSIIFTDSIPLFAVLFKILSPVLPSTFQYFGLWGVMCMTLQCLLATMIFKKFTDKDYNALIGGVLITIAPVLFPRMLHHSSLSGQWLILLSFFPLIYPEKFESLPKKFFFWLGLGILCASTHMYFIPICGISVLGYILEEFIRNRKINSVISALAFVIGGL